MKLLRTIFSKPNYDELRFYNNQFETTHSVKTDFFESYYVVLDTETSGLQESSEIVSIGAVQLNGYSLKPTEVLDIILNSKDRNQEALAIHGVMETGNENEKTKINELLQFLGSRILIGHHISFDVKMLNQWIGKYYPGFRLKNNWIDTAHLAKRIHKEEIQRTVGGHHFLGLDNLCKLYDIPIENRHTALGDAYMTAILFLKLISRLKKRGVNRLAHIL